MSRSKTRHQHKPALVLWDSESSGLTRHLRSLRYASDGSISSTNPNIDNARSFEVMFEDENSAACLMQEDGIKRVDQTANGRYEVELVDGDEGLLREILARTNISIRRLLPVRRVFHVATSQEGLDIVCPHGVASPVKFRGILILCELTWDHRKRTDFYGYKVALELIRRGTKLPLLFVSFLERRTILNLDTLRDTAALLVNIFPHILLPANFHDHLKSEQPSEAKWVFINCFLRTGGLWNFFYHQIDRLCLLPLKRNRLEEELARLSAYTNSLDMVGQDLFARAEAALEEEDLDESVAQLQSLSSYLKQQVATSTLTEGSSSRISKPPMLLIEDNPDMSKTLEKGFGAYFEVTAVTDPQKALELLERDAMRFSTVLSDLLLESEDGFWQESQGIDILNRAANYPHLVVHGLTSLPKSMVPELERATDNRVTIWPKEGSSHLPQGCSFGWFAEMILKDIRQRPSSVRTPELGLWVNGGSLRQFYVAFCQTEAWQDSWKAIRRDVETFLDRCQMGVSQDREEVNHDKLIPTQLCSFKVDQKFDAEKLTRIVKHRMVILDFSIRDDENRVDLSEIFRLIGYATNHHKQYLTSVLGFSYQVTEIDSVYAIANPILLSEEELWLSERFRPIEEAFPGLSELVHHIEQRIPQIHLPRKQLRFGDVDRFLQAFAEQRGVSPRVLRKINTAVAKYIDSDEMNRLRREREAQITVESLVEMAAAAN